jgi:hypothetical protein
MLTAVFAAPVCAEAPPGAEQTKNGTIIWKAPRTGDAAAPTPAPGNDTSIIWNDDPKTVQGPKAVGTPDRNGIIWNDPPAAGATAKAAPPTPPPVEQSVSAQKGPCREYDTEIAIEGRRQAMRGTACRQPDGRWRVISQVPR